MFELRQFRVWGLVGLPLEETLEQLSQGIERGILVVRYASAFPPYMGLMGHVLFQHLIGVGKGSRPPRPPNRAGGSPAHGSPVGSFLIGIGVLAHRLRVE